METSQKSTHSLKELLGIQFPIIMAPMFLVSNEKMVIEAVKAGITGAIPALNYRSTDELRKAIQSIKKEVNGPFGINLIVNKSNFLYKDANGFCNSKDVNGFCNSKDGSGDVITLDIIKKLIYGVIHQKLF